MSGNKGARLSTEIDTEFWVSYFNNTLIDASKVSGINANNSIRLTFGRAMVEG